MEQSAEMPCPEVMIPLDWTPVIDAKGQPADCHTKGLTRTKTLRNLLVGPQVYRWVVRDRDRNIVNIYICETGNVRNRLALCRNGHKKAATRELLEKIALLDARVKGLKVRNRNEDANVKLLRQWTKTMSDPDLSKLLQQKLQQLAPPTQDVKGN